MVLHYGDLTDSTCLVHIISQVQPSEIYNLGAQSHVKVSFDMADYTAQVDALGTLRLLDAVRTCGMASRVRVYQASTSELYGKVVEVPQKETTPFYPRSPYGACPRRRALSLRGGGAVAVAAHDQRGALLGPAQPSGGRNPRAGATPGPASRRGQAVRLLDHQKLPRGVRHVLLQRHSVQPREPASR